MFSKKILSIVLLVAASAAFVGCTDNSLGFTENQIAYKTNFEAAFGKIDPNQDWNLVAQLANSNNLSTRAFASKTTPAGEFEISVLPENQAAPLTTEKMKKYSKMLPESNLGAAPYDKTNLGRVTQDFLVTTSKVVLYPVYWWTEGRDEIGLYYYSDEDGSVPVTDNEGNPHNIVKIPITNAHPDELEYKYEEETTWSRFYNYNDFNTYVTEEYVSYLATNYSDKYVICDGSQYGSGGHVPYNFNNGILLEYKGKTSLQYNTAAAAANEPFDYYDVAVPYDVVSILAEAFPTKFRCVNDDEYYFATQEGGERWASVLSFLQTFNNNDPRKVDPAIGAAEEGIPLNDRLPLEFRSKGIVVDLPARMKVGFYVTNNSDTRYSEGYLNEKMPWTGHTDEDQCYVATYQSDEVDAKNNPVRYLAFEDWFTSGDFDLNDVVFRVYGIDEVHDNEETTESGLLVCEDLGNYDFDFNDVVLKLDWVKSVEKQYIENSEGVVTGVKILGEQQKFTITGMAAGGTLESTVKYNGANVEEIHRMLNGSAPSILNAGPQFGGEGKKYTYTLNNNDWDATRYPNGYVSQVFGEGLVTFGVSNGTTAQKIVSSQSYKDIGAPLMMLLPVDFNWAQEFTPIKTAYGNFENWVENSSYTQWINNRDNSKVTLR